MRPYVGITDFTSFEQVSRMLGVLRAHRQPGSNRMLHVGVMMSYKTLIGAPTKWAGVFPKNEEIAGIFGTQDRDLYYCLHYADYKDLTISAELADAIEYGGRWIKAIQLDMVWPDPGLIATSVRAAGMDIEVILQVGEKALEQVGNDPDRLIRKLQGYRDVVNRVLLDKSMGRGVGMSATELRPFATAIRRHLPQLGLVVAGGLGPDSLELLGDLPREFIGLSIDAQTRLKPDNDPLKPNDWGLAEEYLIKSLRILH